MKKTGLKVSLFLAMVFVILLITSGCGQSQTGKISASGTVEATEVNVNSETGGKIMDILADEGKTVKTGDVLARLDSTVQALQVQEAQAALTAAQEKSKETKSGTREQSIAQAKAAVQQMMSLQSGAKNSMDNASDNLSRLETLLKEGGATPQQVSDARTKYETAKAQYEAYTAQLNSAKEQLNLLQSGSTQETINIADAGVAQAQANLAIAKAQLVKTILSAPTDGIVSSVNFNRGEFVSPGAAIMNIIETNDRWIKIYVTENQLPKIKLGQKADIYIDAFPGQAFAGTVSYISEKAEFTPKNLQTKEERVNMVFAVKVKISDDKNTLKPGLPADVDIITR